MADFMARMDPFLIFPEEVWELILDEMEDSQDAWNLLKAFPQLDATAALQKKKRFWLFGLIIPHLIPWRESCWIKEKDLLNCRQVCRKWSTAVDGFLEGQPQLRAYHHRETPGQLLPEGRFHWNVKSYLEDGAGEEKIHFGGTGFSGCDYYSPMPGGPPIQRFLRNMATHPPVRSPFLSRALSISNWEDEDDVATTDFVPAVLALHRKFGEHVWFYKVEIWWDSLLRPTCLFQNIRYLPNLKMLHVMVDYDFTPPASDPNVAKLLEQLGKDLPALPFLETLRFEDCPVQLSHFLIGRFAAQIRRLDLHMELWRDEYSQLFPNLTEFDVTDWRTPPVGDEMKNLLLTLEAPLLSKLQVKFPNVEKKLLGSCPLVIEDDVFQWLKRFPNLKFLNVGNDCEYVHSSERGVLDPASDLIPSLQFLAIQHSFGMNYNFLRCLPSLQHLQLYVSSKPFVIDGSTNPVVKILEEIQTASMYKSNIWELLPKLRTVTLIVNGYRSCYYSFNREGYEFERRGLTIGSRSSSAVDSDGDEDALALAPLRKDILEFLRKEFERKQLRRSGDMDWFWDWDDEEEDSDLDFDFDFGDDSDAEGAEEDEVDVEVDEEMGDAQVAEEEEVDADGDEEEEDDDFDEDDEDD